MLHPQSLVAWPLGSFHQEENLSALLLPSFSDHFAVGLTACIKSARTYVFLVPHLNKSSICEDHPLSFTFQMPFSARRNLSIQKGTSSKPVNVCLATNAHGLFVSLCHFNSSRKCSHCSVLPLFQVNSVRVGFSCPYMHMMVMSQWVLVSPLPWRTR